MTLNEDQQLRKQCLEWAIDSPSRSVNSHLEITAVAADYYDWIVNGTYNLPQKKKPVFTHFMNPSNYSPGLKST